MARQPGREVKVLVSGKEMARLTGKERYNEEKMGRVRKKKEKIKKERERGQVLVEGSSR